MRARYVLIVVHVCSLSTASAIEALRVIEALRLKQNVIHACVSACLLELKRIRSREKGVEEGYEGDGGGGKYGERLALQVLLGWVSRHAKEMAGRQADRTERANRWEAGWAEGNYARRSGAAR